MNKLGKVVLIGAGPGDLGLMTVKGQEILKQADCIVYDRLLNKKLLAMAPMTCEKIFVGKANHIHTMAQDNINELLYEKAKDYNLVVRLKGGDPYVFGRGGEEALYLLDKGVEVEVIPGISSSIAALNYAGIPITHRGLSKGFQVITAHSKKDALADIDYSQLTDPTVTYVFLMGLAHVGEIARGLINVGRDASTPAAVISNGTTNHQKKVCATLADIEQAVLAAKLDSPAIIVVGDVVRLSETLNFSEQRPLFGTKVFLPIINSFDYSLNNKSNQTCTNQLEDDLSNLGADVVSVCSGTISPIKFDFEILSSITEQDYFVFTSANGVKAFFWNLFEVNKLDVRVIAKVHFAAIGQKTAETLKEFGFRADIVSKKQTGEDLADAFNELEDKNISIYWFCQAFTSEGFEKSLSDDFSLNKIVCYENVANEEEYSPETIENVSQCDFAIYTSGSNAKAAYTKFKDYLPKRILSIGPACSKVIRSLGFEVEKEAEISSYNGILELLK